ncbi:MAG: hypothetical protein R3F11_26820 [Verrucomicrobiales bacterium]
MDRLAPFDADRAFEDLQPLFFDADADGDNDLLITGGSGSWAS